MAERRPYHPPSTVQQIHRLFEVWEETGSITDACKAAGVSRSTFYYWKKRFEEGGYAALGNPDEAVKTSANRTPDELAQQIVALKQRHPGWGKRQIAQEILSINEDLQTLSPNTVRRVLREAGLWIVDDE